MTASSAPASRCCCVQSFKPNALPTHNLMHSTMVLCELSSSSHCVVFYVVYSLNFFIEAILFCMQVPNKYLPIDTNSDPTRLEIILGLPLTLHTSDWDLHLHLMQARHRGLLAPCQGFVSDAQNHDFFAKYTLARSHWHYPMYRSSWQVPDNQTSELPT